MIFHEQWADWKEMLPRLKKMIKENPSTILLSKEDYEWILWLCTPVFQTDIEPCDIYLYGAHIDYDESFSNGDVLISYQREIAEVA